jgi:signal transduction histidine kinase
MDLHSEILLVFFIYGLAFFSMGIILVMEARRSPLLAEARVLWPLAFFGLIHGSHEWMEMATLANAWYGMSLPAITFPIRIGMLALSFLLLMVFGLQVLGPQKPFWRIHDFLVCLGFLTLYGALTLISVRGHSGEAFHWVTHADVLARYTLAVPGAAMAALALNRQAHQARSASLPDLARNLRLAAWGFAFYSLSQIFVTPADLFPARFLNSEAFLRVTGIPVQALRAAMAALVTTALMRATQNAEKERQRRYSAAQEARLQALEQIQRDLEEREALRRELLHRTVVAQEEERARIARELHDETAQFLTALSLELATLRKSLQRRSPLIQRIERLQELCQRMSAVLQRLVHDLRPAQLDDLGLVAALQYLSEESAQWGLTVTLNVEGSPQRLDSGVETVLFRIAQEALTNVARHAGCAQAAMSLGFTPEQVTLKVRDQGVGFDPQKNHTTRRGLGLASMRERAESIGGQFQVTSAPGQGTLIQVCVPLSEAGLQTK